jgi:tRNA-dihydrouridine synthase A
MSPRNHPKKLSSPKISVAPMLDWTTRHERYFLRLISRHVVLYTEMISTGAILHGDRERFFRFNTEEHPLVIQLGGSDSVELAKCAVLAEAHGFDEINLNVGCPSDRVQNARFGACLMADPKCVRDGVEAMRAAVNIPVTVKTRIGIDELDSYELLCQFVATVAEGGCEHFIVHARKAWLQGLSPKQNREVPPLEYEKVYQLKKDFPHFHFTINGGIKTYEDIDKQLLQVDGVMIGREAYQRPYFLAEMDARYFDDAHFIPSRKEVVLQYREYVESELTKLVPLSSLTRHILGLYHGEANGRLWRRILSESAHLPGAGIEVIDEALGVVL